VDSFEHPEWQTAIMFMGEILCLMLFYGQQWYKKKVYDHKSPIPYQGYVREFKPYVFSLSAMADMIATTLMNIGLLMTTPSVYQMLRGSIVIFTGVFSVFFLGRVLRLHHWLGIGLVTAGAAIVGVASTIYGDSDDASNPVVGAGLVIVAQAFSASQFIIQEKLLSRYKMPVLEAVGFEGIFGLSILFVILTIANLIPGDAHGALVSTEDAIIQLSNNSVIIGMSILVVFSIGAFNFFGLTVTTQLSSTHRATLDSTRTITIWLISLLVGWEEFQWLQLIGFIVLLCGTLLYNEVIIIRQLGSYDAVIAPEVAPESERSPLLDDSRRGGPMQNQVSEVRGSVNDDYK